jgi:hypothetical protein
MGAALTPRPDHAIAPPPFGSHHLLAPVSKRTHGSLKRLPCERCGQTKLRRRRLCFRLGRLRGDSLCSAPCHLLFFRVHGVSARDWTETGTRLVLLKCAWDWDGCRRRQG